MGESLVDDEVIYLDYNSMYPAIMSNLDVPFDMRKA